MITEYGRAGEVSKAMKLFEEMPQRNQVSWNAMLTVLLESDCLDAARRLFREMPQRNSVSYTSILTGLSRSGFVSEARKIFDSIPITEQNVFSWTAMISCYSHNFQPWHSLKLFSILYGEFFSFKILPNSHTFSILLKSCVDVQSLVMAIQIHAMALKFLDMEHEKTVFVNNSLIDLYSKLGGLADAEKIFNGLKWKELSSWNVMMAAYAHHLLIDKALEIFNSTKNRDILSWNIMMSGFAESGRHTEAVELFLQLLRLQKPETTPNPSTYTIVLTVCATRCMLEWGRQIHTCTAKCGLYFSNVYIGNSLINMYARCSLVEESEQVFDEIYWKDTVSWNSLVLGLGQNGYCRKALEVAEKALKLGVYNYNTFIGLLTSCSHGGLVEEGLEYFSSMSKKFGIDPSLDHYICVIDMLGRAGRIVEAHNLLLEMPFAPNSIAWAALLSACVIHGNEEVGEIAARELRHLEPGNAASYVMLAKIYIRTGKLEQSRRLVGFMDEIGLRKKQGFSCII
ncbi:PREDICTED: pentatricopeptide repeat-containing protein At2g13600-like [Nelumbo nucifera]|nr:PREDICTED: pentatricopeptide repeat-containing protein At2g13600-like [Nelumbo nucifera]